MHEVPRLTTGTPGLEIQTWLTHTVGAQAHLLKELKLKFFLLPHMCQLAIKKNSLYMQGSTMDCILDQKRNITGKPGETLAESGVQLMATCQRKSFSFDNYTIIMLRC